jgi:hypothetical protein
MHAATGLFYRKLGGHRFAFNAGAFSLVTGHPRFTC